MCNIISSFIISETYLPIIDLPIRLWLFTLDYANLEREIAEPLMDLKTAIGELERNATFQKVMATLLAVGNALNGAKVKFFE